MKHSKPVTHTAGYGKTAQIITFSTAKETQKLVTFKLFEYLICSIPEF